MNSAASATLRTFHIGGAASRSAAVNTVEVKSTGTIRMHNMKTVQHEEKGHLVATSRSCELSVIDEFGRERERYKVPYGAILSVQDGDSVEPGQLVASWDPHTHPVVTEVSGRIQFEDREVATRCPFSSCGTKTGLMMTPLVEGGDIVEPLRERVLGRVAAIDVLAPGSDTVILEAGTLLDEAAVEVTRNSAPRRTGS